MEDLLRLSILHLPEEAIKLLMFCWNITKCTVLFFVSWKLLIIFSDKIFRQIVLKIESQERARQLLTLKSIIVHTIEALIGAIYIMNMLFLFGIDVRPLLATAGVMGVAVGFGAKRFVEDVITGITILLEGQIRVGDYVEIHGKSGFVEKITLNLVTVRSIQGAVYFIRCGSIDSILNYTMKYSYAFFAFDVAYRENIDHVTQTIEKSFEKLLEDKDLKKLVIGKSIEIWGLDEFRESSLCVKCRIKTQPKGQWTIKRAFNKIIKEMFEAENIEIPFNQLVVTQRKQKD